MNHRCVCRFSGESRPSCFRRVFGVKVGTIDQTPVQLLLLLLLLLWSSSSSRQEEVDIKQVKAEKKRVVREEGH
jgi:hypothetical protein